VSDNNTTVNLSELPGEAVIRRLANGAFVAVLPPDTGHVSGRAVHIGCPWLIRVRHVSNDPDWYPDFPEDLWDTVSCNARVRFVDLDQGTWECECGHHHYGMEREAEIAYEREAMERFDETGRVF
jgi:hypothetical protein